MANNTNTVSAIDFLELVTCRGGEAMRTATGPRVQGSDDETWTRQTESAKRSWRTVDATVEERSAQTHPLLLAIAACEDEYLPSRENADALVAEWLVGRLKRRYQGLRLDGKRPWPEFCAAIRTACGVTSADASALMLTVGAPVAIESDGAIVVADSLLDKPFDTEVIGLDGARTTLGALARVAYGKRAGAGTFATCNSLAMSVRGSAAVMRARIASRVAELERGDGIDDSVASRVTAQCAETACR
jgi:hypothetical protein